MTALAITKAHRAARSAASIALAGSGAGASSVRLYTDLGGTLLAVRSLESPPGTVRGADGRIVLNPAASDELVLLTGGAGWGAWCDGDGVPIAGGHVTDETGQVTSGGVTAPHPSGIGAFILKGTTGTSLYEGGVVALTSTVLG